MSRNRNPITANLNIPQHPCWAVHLDLASMQLTFGTIYQSTCPVDQRMGFPLLYLGDNRPRKECPEDLTKHTGIVYIDREDVVDVVRRINLDLQDHEFLDLLTSGSEEAMRDWLRRIYKKYGLWIAHTTLEEEMTPDNPRNTRIQPRKSKNRRAAKHSQLHKVMARESRGNHSKPFQRSEPERVIRHKHKPVVESLPDPQYDEVAQLDAIQRHAEQLMQAITRKEYEQEVEAEEQAEAKPKRSTPYNEAEVRMVSIGKVPVVSARKLCRKLQDHYMGLYRREYSKHPQSESQPKAPPIAIECFDDSSQSSKHRQRNGLWQVVYVSCPTALFRKSVRQAFARWVEKEAVACEEAVAN